MAEVLAIAIADQQKVWIESRSASVIGLDNKPAHPHAVRALAEKGLDLSMHVSQPVTEELLEWADHVLCMEIAHTSELRDCYPEYQEQIALLGPFGGGMEIADPLGGWRGRFRRSRDEIATCIGHFVEQLPAQIDHE